MDKAWEILFSTCLGFSLLLIITRIIGNKQLGQLNVFTYISGIVIGNMAGVMIVHPEIDLLDAAMGMVFWCALTLAIEFINLKSPRARVLMDGQPVIVIKKGKIMYRDLKKERMNIDDLTMLLRTNHVFSILDVDYAILEPNGELSILKKQGRENPTKDDLGMPSGIREHIPSEIIVDGSVVRKNLTELNLTQDWLDTRMHEQGILKVSDVLYAELQGDGILHVQLKDDYEA